MRLVATHRVKVNKVNKNQKCVRKERHLAITGDTFLKRETCSKEFGSKHGCDASMTIGRRVVVVGLWTCFRRLVHVEAG